MASRASTYDFEQGKEHRGPALLPATERLGYVLTFILCPVYCLFYFRFLRAVVGHLVLRAGARKMSL
eukprot:scaffold88077_cov36-Tisochrysis_lutea.AAC.1